MSARVDKDVLESGKCLEETGFFFVLRPLLLFLSLDHIQKTKSWSSSSDDAHNLHL